MKKRMIKGILTLALCIGLTNGVAAFASNNVAVDDGPVRCFLNEKEDKKEDKKDKKDAKATDVKEEKKEDKKDKKDAKATDVKEDKKDKKDAKATDVKEDKKEDKKDKKDAKATDVKEEKKEDKKDKKDAKATDVKEEKKEDKKEDKKTNSNLEEKNNKEEKSEKKTKKLDDKVENSKIDTKETTLEMLEESEKAIAPCKRYSVGEFWTPENEKLLTEDQKLKLKEFRAKNENGENLSLDEVEILKEFRIAVIKLKLGEEKFSEYEKLMERRDGDKELTLEERARLYEFNKEIMGKK